MNEKDKTKGELINELGKTKRRIGELETSEAERKEAEETLRESEEKYRQLTDSVRDVFFAMDEDLRYTYWNKASEKLVEISAKDAIGKTIFDIFPDTEDTRKVVSVYKEVLKTQRSRSFINEYELRGKTYFFEISAYPSKSGLSVFTKDITERKKTEEALKKSQEKLRFLLENIPDFVITVDHNHKILMINRGVAGITVKQATGTELYTYVEPAHHEIMRESLEKVFQTGMPEKYEVLGRGPEGPNTAWYETRVSPNKIDNQVVSVTLISTDITERKKAEERIREYTEELAVRNRQLKVETEKAKKSDRLKSEFLANMSHEIRTPLTAIKGAAYLLDKGSLSSEQKKLCSIIGQSGERLLEIINDILDLTRIEAGEVRLEEKEFSLKKLLKRIISGLKLKAKKKGLELKMILPSDLPSKIVSDEGKITQILSDLITNALKFTERGKVELRVERLADSKIQILVKDTGIGIPKEKLSMIFNKFEQVNGTIRRKHGGTGLGLTIAKELVDLLGGKIKVKSTLGKGSTFSFSFPYKALKQREVSDKAQAQLEPKIKKKTKKDINILIAEDDDFGYYIIERFLEDYTITRAKDGKDALEKIKNKSYDLVLMDIQMPVMDGLEATRKIREKDFHLPIIALTAKAMKGDKEKCLSAGCNDYIAKPIVPEELTEKINQHIIRKVQRRGETSPE